MEPPVLARRLEPAAAAGRAPPADAPLATRMRPRTLDELVGQQRLLAPGSALRRAIEEGRSHSMILHGPPGTGKTTLARLVAPASGAAFEEESAVQAGRAEVRAVIERARQRLSMNGRPTILFVDEIHRFNKAQQDALLPAVEDGAVALIGATTENPSFEVNSALISRTRVYELEALTRRPRSRSCSTAPSPVASAATASSTRTRSSSSRSAPAATPARRSTRSSSPAKRRARGSR